MKQRRYGEAAAYAKNESLKESGGGEFWLTQLARALIRLSDFRSALETARKALEIKPDNLYAVSTAADALGGLKRYDEALEHYKELLREPRLVRKGRKGILSCLAAMKEWELLLDKLASWDLPEAESLPWRIKALSGAGDIDAALEASARLLELSPHTPSALWERTELEIKKLGLDAVISRIGRMARIPSLPQIYREIYASLLRRAGRENEALDIYKAIAAGGGQSRVQKKQVFTMAKSGQEIEAIPLLEELIRVEPEDTYLNSCYVAACKRIDEVERGITFYNNLLGLFPEAKSIYGRIKSLHKHLERKP